MESSQGSVEATAKFDFAGGIESILHVYLYSTSGASVHVYSSNPINGYRSINIKKEGTASDANEWLGGNVLIFTAILMPLFILLIGLVTDIGRALVYKEELNKACMIAAEEACKKIDIDYAQSSGNSILDSSFEQDLFKYFEQNYKPKQNFILNYINYDIAGGIDNPKYLEVKCEAEVKCIFLKIVGIENIKIHSQANGRLRSLATSPVSYTTF